MAEIARNNDLERILILSFLRVIKKHKVYVNFMMTMDKTKLIANSFVNKKISSTKWGFASSINYDFPATQRSYVDENKKKFSSCVSIDELINRLKLEADNCCGVKTSFESNKDYQDLISFEVNTIIHNCIEPSVTHNFELLNEIGKETFEMTCKKIFGDDFVDETPQVPKLDIDTFKKILNMQDEDFYNDETRRESFDKLMESLRERLGTINFTPTTAIRYNDDWIYDFDTDSPF